MRRRQARKYATTFDALSALVEQSRASSNYDRRLKVQGEATINRQVAVTKRNHWVWTCRGAGKVGFGCGCRLLVIVLPADAIEPTVAMSEMIRVSQERGGLVLLAMEVVPPLVPKYGEFDVATTDEVRGKRSRERWKARS